MQIITAVSGDRNSFSDRSTGVNKWSDNEAFGGGGCANDNDADDPDNYDSCDGAGGSAPASDPATNEHNERIFRRLMPNYQQKEPMACELCGDVFVMPVSYHMLTTHPGCGHNSGGRGYTSNGVYKSGWSGACGEGGIAWYLLCETCRDNYMQRRRGRSAALGSDRYRKSAAAAVRRTTVAAPDDVVNRRKSPGQWPKHILRTGKLRKNNKDMKMFLY